MSAPAPDPAPVAMKVAPRSPQPQALERHARRLAKRSSPVWLCEEVGRRLGDKLDDILLRPRTWLEWGGWQGASQAEVVRRHPEAAFWQVEEHEAFRAAAAQAWVQAHPRPWWKPWLPTEAPVLSAQALAAGAGPGEGVDLVWASMGLHALPDAEATFRRWHAALKVDGFLMCSGLGPDTVRELSDLFEGQQWGPATVRFADMHDLGDALVKAGFADPVMDMEHLTLTWPDAPAMLAELRTWGGNVAAARFSGWRTPRWRANVLRQIEQRLRRPDGRLALTVEVVYGHAVKPLPRALISEETRVSVDDMRRMIHGSRREKP